MWSFRCMLMSKCECRRGQAQACVHLRAADLRWQWGWSHACCGSCFELNRWGSNENRCSNVPASKTQSSQGRCDAGSGQLIDGQTGVQVESGRETLVR
jgi:hypothetical protein